MVRLLVLVLGASLARRRCRCSSNQRRRRKTLATTGPFKKSRKKFQKFAKTENGLEKLSKENLKRRLSRVCCYEK